MTTLHTRPIPRPTATHEHAWLVESRHPTSTGLVLYVRCVGCGIRRIDEQAYPSAVPAALSRTVTS